MKGGVIQSAVCVSPPPIHAVTVFCAPSAGSARTCLVTNYISIVMHMIAHQQAKMFWQNELLHKLLMRLKGKLICMLIAA